MEPQAGKPSNDDFAATRALDWLFQSWRFPAFLLCVVVLYKALLLTMLLLPTRGWGGADFAEDFKMWCFGYDPATGKLQPMYVISMLIEPLVLGGGVLLLWGGSLRQIWRSERRRFVPAASTALVFIFGASMALGAMRKPAPKGRELPFPAEALRTVHEPPRLDLHDQNGAPVSLSALTGKVVIVTGVYASCGFTCPMIMGQAKRAVAALTPAEREDVVVVGVTLDPEHDDAARLKQMADGQGVRAPTFRLVTGDAKRVNTLLDELQIARARNPKTGVIDHANLFILVDRRGKIAYRFTLGERQERWLQKAVALLLAEARV